MASRLVRAWEHWGWRGREVGELWTKGPRVSQVGTHSQSGRGIQGSEAGAREERLSPWVGEAYSRECHEKCWQGPQVLGEIIPGLSET